MPIYFDRAKQRYRFTFHRVVHGRRYRASRLLPAGWSREQAERFDVQETARLYATATGVSDRQPLISEAVRLYLEHRAPGLRYSRGTILALQLMMPAYQGRTLAELPDVAREYRAAHPELQPATVRNRLAYLRAACRYAWTHHGLGQEDHSRRMSLPAVRNARHVYLRPDELQRLLAACQSDELRALVRLAYYTGLRWVKELLPRERADIVREGGDVWLRVPDTKTGRPHMAWIHPAARKDLAYLPFARHWRTYYAGFEAARTAAGMPELHMHDLRHSMASALISSGATLPEVGAALGHSTPQSTARYAHLYPERLAAVVRKMPTLTRATKPRRRASD